MLATISAAPKYLALNMLEHCSYKKKRYFNFHIFKTKQSQQEAT
jgi:hypothetical protein